ncbi:MAG: glutamate--cysteine ligase [Bauldia sp.]|nr:glutamate--cysteine ligase [Bauldia sp.]
MARDVFDATPIESRDQLVATLEAGGKPKSAWRVGTEHEKFGFRKADLSPVPYDGPRGIRQLLETMEGLLGWRRVEDSGRLIGLLDPVGGGAISLEPGGQFELSGAPLETIHQTGRELNAHLAQLRECAEPLGIGFLGIGFSPKWSLAETPVMPKSRYAIMSRYMPKVGTLGLDMMFRTCTVQANLDFADEADMRVKMRVGMALQPVVTALFANSPFREGKPSGFQSYRSHIWLNTDPHRTGILPFVFDEGFGFERYVDWALDVPLYFVKRGDTYHDTAGASFRDLMAGRLPQLPGERAMMSDWENHLTTLFPEVRLKRFLEMRGADAGPWRRICAVPALWVGLLYDSDVLDAADRLVREWTVEEILEMRRAVPVTALRTPFRGGTLLEIARTIVGLARTGLSRRMRLNEIGADETIYIEALEETVADGETPAERLLEKYRGWWKEDVGPLFRRYAY